MGQRKVLPWFLLFLGLSAVVALTSPPVSARPPDSAKIESAGKKPTYPPEPVFKKSIELASDAFKPGERIPARHTDDGANLSPPLKWKNLPKQTKSIVIMLEDPDGTAGNFSHWLVYDLEPGISNLPEGLPAKPANDKPPGGKQGTNSLMRIGYAGPAPVPGSGTHHYTFRIFALDRMLDVKPGALKEEIQKNMYGHTLAQGVLMGTYAREKSKP